MAKNEACEECKQNCSLFHTRKKEPSPSVTTFHKILFGVYDYSKDLCLPQKISQMIPVLLGKVYDLEDTNGQKWQVTLGKKDDHLAFRKGWDKFFADHGLREGYILAFHYIINSHFVVQIIDNTGFEKLRFPVANGKKRKRSKVDVNTNAVGECQNLSNNSTKKQGSAFYGISDSEARIHSQPMPKDKFSSLENGNGMYQHVASDDSDIQQFFMINRDAGYKYEEGRSPLFDFINLDMQSKVGRDGSSDEINHPSSTSAKCNAVASILDENPVSAKVVSGEPPAKVAAPTLSNNNNVYLRRENVAEIVNDHHGDHKSVLPTSAKVPKVAAPTCSNNNNVLKRENIAEVVNDHHVNHQSVPPTSAELTASTFSNNNNVYLKRENFAEVANDHHGDHQSVLPKENRAQLHSECRIESSPTTFKRVKTEAAAVSKKHSGEIVKLPKLELMTSSEKYLKFKERSGQIFSGDVKSNEVCKVVKTEPVDSSNEERLDASAFSFTVMIGSSELLELPTSVTLGREKKVVNLKGLDKRVWPVLYQHKLGIKVLTSGWKNFFVSYKLQIGVECDFILENEAETIFRIDVKSK